AVRGYRAAARARLGLQPCAFAPGLGRGPRGRARRLAPHRTGHARRRRPRRPLIRRTRGVHTAALSAGRVPATTGNPMGMLKKDHILGAGSAALAGGAAGAAIGGMLAGPAGIAVGAAAGGALGAVAGNRASEKNDPRDDLGHFQQMYRNAPYFVADRDWHDYALAYRYGRQTCRANPGMALEQVESQLHGGWEAAARFGSRLPRTQERPAVEHAWRRLTEAQHAGAEARLCTPREGPTGPD